VREGDAARYAIAAIPDPPCVGCGFAKHCRIERQACEPFRRYVDTGAVDRDAPRRPTRATFRSIFNPTPGRPA
jgi:hypothetical protein